ncbi:MAG: hypothetical protein FWF01_01185 [Alphaproteobacteria bacterium]|nr:hypothetical protein [Alphaproteobacteria bacterium]
MITDEELARIIKKITDDDETPQNFRQFESGSVVAEIEGEQLSEAELEALENDVMRGRVLLRDLPRYKLKQLRFYRMDLSRVDTSGVTLPQNFQSGMGRVDMVPAAAIDKSQAKQSGVKQGTVLLAEIFSLPRPPEKPFNGQGGNQAGPRATLNTREKGM